MKSTAFIEKGKDNTFGIFTSDLQLTVSGGGETVEEAKADFETTLKDVRAYLDEQGVPNELTDVTFEYKYDVVSMPDYLEGHNLSKAAKRIGTNSSYKGVYKKNEYNYAAH